MRSPRPKSNPTPWAQKKASVRIVARLGLIAGKIERAPCAVCGTLKNLEMHHEDYNEPLAVIWLCKSHHNELHRLKRDFDDEGIWYSTVFNEWVQVLGDSP